MRYPAGLILFAALTLLPWSAPAAPLTADQVLDRVGPSVVAVRGLDGAGRPTGAGSGVVLPSGRIGAGCRHTESAVAWRVGQPGRSVAAALIAADRDGDLCLFEPVERIGTPCQPRIGRLRQHTRMFAVGRPRGLGAAVTAGQVVRPGDGKTTAIVTTATVSPGADGGGLFDDRGRLVGVVTLKQEGDQWLARPVAQLLALDPGPEPEANATPDWQQRAVVLEQSGDREGLLAWCRRWTAAEATSADAWFGLGTAYSLLGRDQAAIDSYRRTVRIDPRHADAWFNLGLTYTRIGRHRDAIAALRRTLELDPADTDGWYQLGLAHLATGNRETALSVAGELERLDPELAARLRDQAGLAAAPAGTSRKGTAPAGAAPGRSDAP